MADVPSVNLFVARWNFVADSPLVEFIRVAIRGCGELNSSCFLHDIRSFIMSTSWHSFGLNKK